MLDTEQMGDRTPSQFYRFLTSKVSDLNLSDELLLNRWFSRLPDAIQTITAGLKTKLTLEELLEHADNVHEMVSAAPSSKSLAALRNPQPDHNRGKAHNRNRARSHSRNNSQSRQSDFKGNGYCWYHCKFGKRANKCHGGDCLASKPKTSGNDRQ